MLPATDLIPGIFRGAREYKDDPEALELAQQTFNERGLYDAISRFASEWTARNARPARVLDLCSATGLCAVGVAQAIPVESVTLVDNDCNALKKAKDRLSDLCNVAAHCVDAVSFRDQRRYDLILMNSAYHHIEDERKIAFLRNAASLLSESGLILLGEHFLPKYATWAGFRRSVVGFYTALLEELERRREPPEAVRVIRRSGLYCWEGSYEYKVSWDVFLSHVHAANLRIAGMHTVWVPGPAVQREPEVGSIAVWLKRR